MDNWIFANSLEKFGVGHCQLVTRFGIIRRV